jgi:hypothetical protein
MSESGIEKYSKVEQKKENKKKTNMKQIRPTQAYIDTTRAEALFGEVEARSELYFR